jgi:hypothetical protein
MNDFDRRLEVELARLLDRVVRTPAPPRRTRSGRRPVVTLYAGSSAGELSVEAVALSDTPGTASPSLIT